MMAVGAMQQVDMERDAGIDCEGLEPLAYQLGVEFTNLGRWESDVEDKKRAARNVDRNLRQGFIHGESETGIAADALAIAERLFHRLAEGDADVLDGVMEVDMGIALGVEDKVDEGMARKQLQHMIKEADPAAAGEIARPVEVDRDRDLGL